MNDISVPSIVITSRLLNEVLNLNELLIAGRKSSVKSSGSNLKKE